MGSRQDRARTQSSIPSHTLLTGPIDGGSGRCSEPPRAGTTLSWGTLGPVIYYIYPYPTYGGVGPASGGLQGARRLAYDPDHIGCDQGGKGVKPFPTLCRLSVGLSASVNLCRINLGSILTGTMCVPCRPLSVCRDSVGLSVCRSVGLSALCRYCRY